jgi:DNA polymerase-4
LRLDREAPARVLADLPACFAARPASRAADFAPLTAPLAVRRACPAASAAVRPCRVPAAFLPADWDSVRCRLRCLVAAAFFAAADRSAFDCAIGPPVAERPDVSRGTRSVGSATAAKGAEVASATCTNIRSLVREATILHADLDAFYASVEQRDDPRLRGRPVIVGAGVVLAASYDAKACGVRTAMGGTQARRLCPHASVVSPRMQAYSEASRAVFEIFADTAPLVEALSIDEAFLDVRGLAAIAGTPSEIAERLRQTVRERVGLPITVGVARTKFLAKVASAVAKPDGLLVIPPAAELAFLHRLPVERLWGVGSVTARKLHAHGIVTVGQVAALGPAPLVSMLGRAAGRQLHALAHNRDPRPVRNRRRRRSIGAQRALGRRAMSLQEMLAVLIALIDRVALRLRKGRRACRTVVLRLRFADYSRATRSSTMASPTAETQTILITAVALLKASAPLIERRGVTLIGIALANLTDDRALQLRLPMDRGRDLDAAMDRVRERFGSGAITRAVLVGRDPGPWVPLLDD